MTASNLGPATPYDSLYADPADMIFAWGIEPPVGFGKLRLGLDVVQIIHGPDLASRMRFGSSYKFGILETMLGINSNSFTAGMEFAAPIVNVGLAYEFIRQDIEGGSTETKIATEFSFKL